MSKKIKVQAKRRRKPQTLETGIRIFPYVFLAAFIAGLIGGSYAYAVQSDLFVLKNVEIPSRKDLSVYDRFQFAGLVPGDPIMNLNLAEIQTFIQKYHPEYEEVIVRRILPHRINVDLKKRRPIAILEMKQRFWIDSKGVILDADAGARGRKYPVIIGIPVSHQTVHVGSQVHYQALDLAIKVIQEIDERDILAKHTLDQIDVTDSANLVLKIDGSIDVRLGNRNLISKLSKLKEAVQTLDLDPNKVRYIDLRFDDFIIGPR